MIEKFKQLVENFGNDNRLPIAFADVEFEFPSDTIYPNLSIKDSKYGLIQVLKGRTVATLSEIHLAVRIGAKITYIEAFVLDSKEVYLFRNALKFLIDERNNAKKRNDSLREQLLKLFVNTLYGKLAQGINSNKGFDIRGNSAGKIGMSIVTQPFFASMITGTLRAGLSSMLVAIEELKKEGYDYVVISVTTDGMLYTVGSKDVHFIDCLKEEYRVNPFEAMQSGKDIFLKFAEADSVLYNKLLEFPAIRLLKHSREQWNYNEFIEIKHSVNKVLNIKTRGQIGSYTENETTIYPLLAKVGHKLQGSRDDQAKELWERYYDKEINKYEMKRLSTINDILDDRVDVEDIVMISELKNFSLDYDFKRGVQDDGKTTYPHNTIEDFTRYRAVAENLRNTKKQRATPQLVEYFQHRAKQNVRLRGGNSDDCKRHFLRALVQDVHPFKKEGTSLTIAKRLRYFGVSLNMVKNAKRVPFVSNVVLNCSSNRTLIRKMLRALGFRSEDKYQSWLDILIHKGVSNKKGL